MYTHKYADHVKNEIPVISINFGLMHHSQIGLR